LAFIPIQVSPLDAWVVQQVYNWFLPVMFQALTLANSSSYNPDGYNLIAIFG
jgi:hypothetical protein